MKNQKGAERNISKRMLYISLIIWVGISAYSMFFRSCESNVKGLKTASSAQIVYLGSDPYYTVKLQVYTKHCVKTETYTVRASSVYQAKKIAADIARLEIKVKVLSADKIN